MLFVGVPHAQEFETVTCGASCREWFLMSCGSTGFSLTLVTRRNVTYSVVTSGSEINLGIHLFGGLLRFNYRHSARHGEKGLGRC